jgi:hypothetical protein
MRIARGRGRETERAGESKPQRRLSILLRAKSSRRIRTRALARPHIASYSRVRIARSLEMLVSWNAFSHALAGLRYSITAALASFASPLFSRFTFCHVQVIYERGEQATGMYFVVDGRVDLLWGPAPPPTTPVPARVASPVGPEPAVEPGAAEGAGRERGPGDAFGELALFPTMAGRFRVETAVAREWGLMHMLPVSARAGGGQMGGDKVQGILQDEGKR